MYAAPRRVLLLGLVLPILVAWRNVPLAWVLVNEGLQRRLVYQFHRRWGHHSPSRPAFLRHRTIHAALVLSS